MLLQWVEARKFYEGFPAPLSPPPQTNIERGA